MALKRAVIVAVRRYLMNGDSLSHDWPLFFFVVLQLYTLYQSLSTRVSPLDTQNVLLSASFHSFHSFSVDRCFVCTSHAAV